MGVFVLGFAVLFGIRAYNDHIYGSADSLTEADVTDLSRYPTDIDGIGVKYVDHGAFQGFHLKPDNKLYNGVVVFYGGAD